MARCDKCGHPTRSFDDLVLKNLKQWEDIISSKTTSGHRLSLDAVNVASLWKALADARSEAEWFHHERCEGKP